MDSKVLFILLGASASSSRDNAFEKENGEWVESLKALSDAGIDLSRVSMTDAFPWVKDWDAEKDTIREIAGADEEEEASVETVKKWLHHVLRSRPKVQTILVFGQWSSTLVAHFLRVSGVRNQKNKNRMWDKPIAARELQSNGDANAELSLNKFTGTLVEEAPAGEVPSERKFEVYFLQHPSPANRGRDQRDHIDFVAKFLSH